MSKTVLAIFCIALLLTSCQQVEADVPDNPEAHATQSLVEKFIETNINYDAEGLMSLYADDLFWMDYGGNDGPLNKGNLDYAVHETMSSEDYEIEFESYIVTPDGRFAVLQAFYSQLAALSGKMATVPAVAVLEFEDGKIISEIWYYNGDTFH
jgi:ketosteroid isomerase-like protein